MGALRAGGRRLLGCWLLVFRSPALGYFVGTRVDIGFGAAILVFFKARPEVHVPALP